MFALFAILPQHHRSALTNGWQFHRDGLFWKFGRKKKKRDISQGKPHFPGSQLRVAQLFCKSLTQFLKQHRPSNLGRGSRKHLCGDSKFQRQTTMHFEFDSRRSPCPKTVRVHHFLVLPEIDQTWQRTKGFEQQESNRLYFPAVIQMSVTEQRAKWTGSMNLCPFACLWLIFRSFWNLIVPPADPFLRAITYSQHLSFPQAFHQLLQPDQGIGRKAIRKQ